MSQRIGMVLLTVGIGLTAGFGAKLSPDVRSALTGDGQRVMAKNAVESRFAEYCSSRSEEGVADGDGCGDSPALGATPAAVLDALSASSEVLSIKTTQARVEYRQAIQRLVDVQGEEGQPSAQGPFERLNGWFSVGGGGFLVGWLLLVAGGWMCRRGSALVEEEGAGSDEAIDFGTLLDTAEGLIVNLHAHMKAMDAPTVADAEECKRRLEAIQGEAIARLCSSGPRVHARYGLHGMAALFSPLSAGERKLNRAWAALVDRHWPEAVSSIGQAEQDLRSTRSALNELV